MTSQYCSKSGAKYGHVFGLFSHYVLCITIYFIIMNASISCCSPTAFSRPVCGENSSTPSTSYPGCGLAPVQWPRGSGLRLRSLMSIWPLKGCKSMNVGCYKEATEWSPVMDRAFVKSIGPPKSSETEIPRQHKIHKP